MTSLQRQLSRKRLGPASFNDRRGTRTQLTRIDETGYSALHPTKGWKRICNKRIQVQILLNYLLTGGQA